jgi:group II intron reverse transcriptase/maturase
VRQAARQGKKVRLTALLHHITIELLERSYFALNRKSAPGIDGVTWQAYGETLEENLPDLHGRIHRGSYRARPGGRSYTPKPDGTRRPLSVLCLEDKIVQQAVVYVLEAIFEEDFLGVSYGFRPGRSQHDALDALHAGIYRKRVNWVLDADIQGFFDATSHDWIRRFLQHRIADKRLLRLIAKWLKAGIVEAGRVKRSIRGTPQGAVISPILANIYLHYVFDLWAHRWRRKAASGDVIIIRYADDIVVGFQHEHEARAFRHAAEQCQRLGEGKPKTFDFLGFTHFCTRSRKYGTFVIGRKTIKKRMLARLQEIKMELRRRLHDPIAVTGRWLNKVLVGHLNYYAVSGNDPSLWWFFTQIRWLWLRALRRRSQRAFMTWEKFLRHANGFFPPIKIRHPLPCHRFDARTRGRSPVR